MTATTSRSSGTTETTKKLVEEFLPPGAPGVFHQHVLDTDSHLAVVPDTIRESSPLTTEPVEVPFDRYLTREFHDLEVEKLWKRVWQMACREDEIPQVGDTLVYDIADLSFIIARVSPTVIKAYPNSCLHRGRKLVDSSPCPARLGEFRCAFHGFTWDLEGSLASVPGSWDFPHIDVAEWELPEARVGRWGGFVFINPDLRCEPFDDFIGDLDRHFAKYAYNDRYTAAHIVKVVPTNWKAAQEAFMESFHVIATHPQLLAQTANIESKYDCWGNFSRAMTPNMLPSSFINWLPTEQDIMNAMLDKREDAPPAVEVPEGKTAREMAGQQARTALAKAIGEEKAEQLCDAELVDSFYFTLFPNLHPWSAYNRIAFRFRPYGNDPDRAIQDVYLLNPYSGERPPASKTHVLADDEDFTAGTEIGPYLARILNQDLYNMPNVQEGMKASVKGTATFSSYQESKIRHFHQLLDEWLARD